MMKAGYSQSPINLRKLFESKSPKAAARIPEWLLRLISKAVCVNDVNYMLNTYGDESPEEFAGEVIKYAGAEYSIVGAENIPEERCIFVSNHPMGGLDGVILINSLSRYCKNGIKLIVNDLLMNLEPLRPVFIPVNKHGRQNQDYLRQMDDAFSSDCQIATFPAGLCSRLIDGKIQDTVWHRNFAVRAVKTGRVIVPVYFEGRNSNFFYRLAKLRKFLGIKFNVEMLFLPHEMFYPVNKKATIHIGKPLELSPEDTPSDITAKTRSAVYALSDELPV